MASPKGRRTKTDVCGVYSPVPVGRKTPLPPVRVGPPKLTAQHHCPRCNDLFAGEKTLRQHFPKCVRDNGNPDSLHWYDHESCGRKPEVSVAQQAIMPNRKVDGWLAMAVEGKSATAASKSNNLNDVEALPMHSSTAVAEPTLPTSSHRDEMPKQLTHTDHSAHQFSNTGLLMPSNTEIPSATESLEKVSTLGPSRSHDSYDQDGEPHFDDWLLDDSSDEKREKDDTK